MTDAGGRPPSSSKASQRFKHFPFRSRMGSKANSTFSPSDILPQDGHRPYPNRPQSDAGYEKEDEEAQPVFGAPAGAPTPGNGSEPPSVFDRPDESQERETEATTYGSNDPGDYDLKAPAPSVRHDNIEELANRFFSTDHLDTILRDPNAGPRFVRFLNQHKPQYATTLTHYIEARKAITAVEYANAIADQIPTGGGKGPHIAATLDDAFVDKSQSILEDLVEEALPAFLTHRMVALVTDSLVKEITGEGAPYLKQLIPNLAEVFCISDPSLTDNPIVYASEDFYNVTQYGRDYSIGRNCRFLQGPRTSGSAVRRLVEAISNGEELCETVLNYRRDGSPFMNLLMIAPLYDNKGDVRYFLGAQIDISPLIEGGKGLDSFSRLLAQDRSDSQHGESRGREPLNLLGELGQMLNEPEADFVRGRMSRSSSQGSGRSTPPPNSRPKHPRRFLSMDDSGKPQPESSTMKTLWADESLGKSGRLPGVYRNYLLVRPYPSLRVTFTSPTLRIPGLLQAKLLDRIGGPQHLRDGILEAMQNSTSVTAKVPWLTSAASGDNRRDSENTDGKPRWIHCTPLFGSDDKVGVWMVILVENEEVTGLLNRKASSASSSRAGASSTRNGKASGFASPQPLQLGAIDGDEGRSSKDMYADYMKEGRPNTKGSKETSASTQERREAFRDFDS